MLTCVCHEHVREGVEVTTEVVEALEEHVVVVVAHYSVLGISGNVDHLRHIGAHKAFRRTGIQQLNTNHIFIYSLISTTVKDISRR